MDFLIKDKDGSRKVVLPLALGIGLVLLVIVLAILLWSATRRQHPPHLVVTKPGELMQLLPSIVGLTQGAMTTGNRIELFQNGALFPPLMRDMEAAKETIHLESYVWWKGQICNEIAALLARKAREGVEVRVLLDASGSSRMDDDLGKMMLDAGVHLVRFHPPRLSNLGRVNNRDHRKIVVIDGRIGYTGGHGIAEEWTGNAQDKKHFRDTFIRAEGPIVSKLQTAFCENWIESTGQVLAGPKYYPVQKVMGGTSAHAAFSSPSGSVSSVELLYYLAISSAKRQLIIQNPYFLPDRDGIAALEAAVDRGVDVRIMMPSDDATDSPVVQHASHHHFGTLLKRGVRIFEYQKTLLHQKIIIVDGTWSCVGSTNFDDRSFELNDEISIGIVDPDIARQLEAAWNDDMKHAVQRSFDEWSNRGLYHKMIDGLFYLANDQM